jgi:hypothetical protein
MNRALALVAAVVFGAVSAYAQQGSEWENDFDENKKDWKEIEAKIPAYPKDANLLEFDGGPATPHHFFLDAQSLSIGADGVVRYSLVIKTGGGATNVTYEGIRCETREQKYYAVGQRDGSWTRARNPQWRLIEPREVNRQYNTLYNDILCNGGINRGIPAGSVPDIVRAMKYGKQGKITE